MIDLTKAKFKTLKAGDVRTFGDEQRDFDTARYAVPNTSHTTTKLVPHSWRPVALIGQTIHASDLCHLEFRRPI